MSFQIVSERLAALQDSNTQLRDLINRLANIKFQPGSVPLGDEDDNVKAELAAEIQQTIKDQEEDLQILQEDVLDLPPAREGSELNQQKHVLGIGVKRSLKELNELVTAFRKAQITAKQSLQKAQRLERELLVKSYLDPKSADTSQLTPSRGRKSPKPQELSHDEKTVNASTDVTLALRRTHDMMASELSRSQFAHEALQQSTQALADLGETYSTLDTLLSSSKNLLGTLLRSQKSDTWYLETAFYILAVTIAWLLFRRLIYGPAWWLVYLPLKLVFSAWIGAFTALGSAVGFIGVEKDGEFSPVIGGGMSILAGSVSSSIVGPGRPTIVDGKASFTRETDTDSPPGEESVSEQVGRIIDDGQNHESEREQAEGNPGTVYQAEYQKNSKKRMWEEPKEAAKQEQKEKDEL